MRKLFDGVASLELEGEGRSLDVLAMNSAEGEQVPLNKSMKARGAVEGAPIHLNDSNCRRATVHGATHTAALSRPYNRKQARCFSVWLTNFENAMRSTLKKLASTGIKTYLEQPRTEWILQQPAQLALTVSQIAWCQTVAAALAGSATHDELRALRAEAICKLEELTAMVGTELSQLQRRSVTALITVGVHNRDVVSRLIAEQCESTGDFAWQMQLRYVLFRQVLSHPVIHSLLLATPLPFTTHHPRDSTCRSAGTTQTQTTSTSQSRRLTPTLSTATSTLARSRASSSRP